MSFTVVPLHNLSLAPTTRIPFGGGFSFQDVPQWLREEPIIANLSRHDRSALAKATHALVAEYPTSAMSEADPDWAGQEPRTIEERKCEEAMLANLAIWIEMPSMVCFTCVFHALSVTRPDVDDQMPVVLKIDSQTPLYCHELDLPKRPDYDDIIRAGKLHERLLPIRRKTAVWTAMRAFWSGLTSYAEDIRYLLFWIALESLFGPDGNNGEITYKLCQRIAFFLAGNPTMARDFYKRAAHCYGIRSQIAHGRWDRSPKMDNAMMETEAIVRTVFRNLANNPQMMEVFQSKARDQFLVEWVFSRSTDLPPFPSK